MIFKLSIVFILSFLNIEANAHSLVSGYSGFGSGFSHPMLGFDHSRLLREG